MASARKIALKCFIILKKCILATYAMFYWFFGLFVTDEHFYGWIFKSRHTHDRDYKLDKWERNFVNHHPSECYTLIATLVAMTSALIGLYFNCIFAPLLLGLHILYGCAVLINISKPEAHIYIVGISMFFEVMALWLAYDFYLMRQKKMKIEAAQGIDTQIVYHKMANDEREGDDRAVVCKVEIESEK